MLYTIILYCIKIISVVCLLLRLVFDSVLEVVSYLDTRLAHKRKRALKKITSHQEIDTNELDVIQEEENRKRRLRLLAASVAAHG